MGHRVGTRDHGIDGVASDDAGREIAVFVITGGGSGVAVSRPFGDIDGVAAEQDPDTLHWLDLYLSL